jgi:hypothetical protein
MDQFIHKQNLQHLREVLAYATDEQTRQQILKLVAEEEAKGRLLPKEE